MQIIRIRDEKQRRLKKNPRFLPEAAEGARIKVLATGCVHCQAMRRNTIEAVERLGLPEGSLECVSDLNEIARMGVMTTPSLVIDGKLMSTGKVLKPEQIISLIENCFAIKEAEENLENKNELQ